MASSKKKYRGLNTKRILIYLIILVAVVGGGLKVFSFFPNKTPTQQISETPTCGSVTFSRLLNADGDTLVLFNLSGNYSQNDVGKKIGVVLLRNSNGGTIGSYDIVVIPPNAGNSVPFAQAKHIGTILPGTQVKIDYSVLNGRGYTQCTSVDSNVIADNPALNPNNPGSNPSLENPSQPILPPDNPEDCIGYIGFTLTPCKVTQATHIAQMTILDIPMNEDDLNDNGTGKGSLGDHYYYCLKTNTQDCGKNDLKKISELDTSKNAVLNNQNGTFNLTFPSLCGDGESKLKRKCKTNGSDYFHAGKTYRVSLFSSNEKGSPIITSGAFYVSHYYPKLSTTISQTATDNYLIKTTISGYNDAGNKDIGTDDTDKLNDYFIQVEGFDNDYLSQSVCLFVPDASTPGTAELSLPKVSVINQKERVPGKYSLLIKDGKDAKNLRSSNPQCKEGNFTYFIVPFEITASGSAKIETPIEDPFGKEKDLSVLHATPQPICPTAYQNPKGYCEKIPTALGIDISTEPTKFVRDVFSIVLFIAGIAAVVFFVQAGYKILTSAGDKEKVGQAREQITAAIMGLIFIILSITILEFIGINILRLPGFGN